MACSNAGADGPSSLVILRFISDSAAPTRTTRDGSESARTSIGVTACEKRRIAEPQHRRGTKRRVIARRRVDERRVRRADRRTNRRYPTALARDERRLSRIGGDAREPIDGRGLPPARGSERLRASDQQPAPPVRVPLRQRSGRPVRIAVLMALIAGVRDAESDRVLRRRDADRVVGHARAQADHRARHVTGDAGAARAARRVPRVTRPDRPRSADDSRHKSRCSSAPAAGCDRRPARADRRGTITQVAPPSR